MNRVQVRFLERYKFLKVRQKEEEEEEKGGRRKEEEEKQRRSSKKLDKKRVWGICSNIIFLQLRCLIQFQEVLGVFFDEGYFFL